MSSISSLSASALNSYMTERIANGTAKSLTRDELVADGFVLKSPTKILTTDEVAAEEAAGRAKLATLKSDDAPENVWGKIVVAGRTVAEIYKGGSVAYYGEGSLAINTDAPLDDIARQLMKWIGGSLQAGPAYENDQNALSSLNDATVKFQSRLYEKREFFL